MINKMKYAPIIIILLLSISATSSAAVKKNETPHYDVVFEYIRSLGAIHNIQETAISESEKGKDEQDTAQKRLLDGIRSATRFKLELNTSINILKKMRLKKPYDTLIPTTVSLYKQKIELFDETAEIAKIFLVATPKPSVDYSKMLARVPEITANVEYIDETIFQTMVLVFTLLIDEKPDREGHMSHLNISTDQKQKLLNKIDGLFGDSLEKHNKNWTVSSAALLKAYLLKDYKCTDEWQK